MLSSPGEAFALVLLCKLGDAVWFRRVVLRQQRGTAKAVASAAPIFAINLVLPLLLWWLSADPGVAIHATTVLGWTCNFKVFAFVCGRGPAYSKSHSLRELFAALVTPAAIALPTDDAALSKKFDGELTAGAAGKAAAAAARPGAVPAPVANGRSGQSRHSARVVFSEPPLPVGTILGTHLRLLALYGSLLAGIVTALKHSGVAGLPLWAVQGLYGVGMLVAHLAVHVPWELLSSLLARRPAVHNAWRPWAPKSLADFWGTRWNRTANDVLRWVVYEPIATGRLLLPPGAAQRPLLRAAPAWRRALGLLCTFGVSGLAHELIWASLAGRPLGRFLPYFLANGVAVLGEGLARQRLFSRHSGGGGAGNKRAGSGVAQGGGPAAAAGATGAAAAAAANGPKQQANGHSISAHAGGLGGGGSGSRDGCSSPKNGSSSSNGSSTGKGGAAGALLRALLAMAEQVLRSAAVFAVIIGLGGWIVWPALAPAIGARFLGAPGITFEQLHTRLFPQQ